jgi:hypothetical protein
MGGGGRRQDPAGQLRALLARARPRLAAGGDGDTPQLLQEEIRGYLRRRQPIPPALADYLLEILGTRAAARVLGPRRARGGRGGVRAAGPDLFRDLRIAVAVREVQHALGSNPGETDAFEVVARSFRLAPERVRRAYHEHLGRVGLVDGLVDLRRAAPLAEVVLAYHGFLFGPDLGSQGIRDC